MNILSKAVILATEAHEGQTRKGTGLPYIVHCLEVMTFVLQHGVTDLQTCAIAVCHDTVEDTEVTPETIRATLGEEVEKGVLALTKPQNLSKQDQRDWMLQSLKNGSPAVRIVKMADRLSNIRDMSALPWSSYSKSAYCKEAEEIARIGANDCPSLSDALSSLAAAFQRV